MVLPHPPNYPQLCPFGNWGRSLILQTLQRVLESRSGAPEQLPKISLALKRESCWCSQSSFVLLACQTFGSVFPNQFSRPCRKLNQTPGSPWLSHCPVLTAGLAEFKPFFFLSDCFPYSLLLSITQIFVQQTVIRAVHTVKITGG